MHFILNSCTIILNAVTKLGTYDLFAPKVFLFFNFPMFPCEGKAHRAPLICFRCVKLLVSKFPQQLAVQDKKFGGAALHWARSREVSIILVISILERFCHSSNIMVFNLTYTCITILFIYICTYILNDEKCIT